jgi:hypothetical protein
MTTALPVQVSRGTSTTMSRTQTFGGSVTVTAEAGFSECRPTCSSWR